MLQHGDQLYIYNPPIRRLAFSWFEPFDYGAGSLVGQGNWQLFGGASDPMQVDGTGRAISPAFVALANANAFQQTALANFNPNQNWVLEFDLVFITDGTAIYNAQVILGQQGDISATTPRMDFTTGAANVCTFNFYTENGSVGSAGPLAFAFDNSHRITWVRDSKTFSWYLDGVLMSTSPFTITTPTPTWFFFNVGLLAGQAAGHIQFLQVRLNGLRLPRT